MNSLNEQCKVGPITIDCGSVTTLGNMLTAHYAAIDSGELRVVDPDGFDPFQVASTAIFWAARQNLVGHDGTTTVSIDDMHAAFDTFEAAHQQAGSTMRAPLSEVQRAMLVPAFQQIQSVLENHVEPSTAAA